MRDFDVLASETPSKMTKLSAATLGFRRFSTRPSAQGSFRPGPEFRLSPKTFQFPKLRSFGGKFLFRQRRPVNSPWWRDFIRCGASHPCLPGRGFSRLRIERCVLLVRLSAYGASFPHVSETRPAATPRAAAAAGTWTARSVSFLRAEGPVFFCRRGRAQAVKASCGSVPCRQLSISCGLSSEAAPDRQQKRHQCECRLRRSGSLPA